MSEEEKTFGEETIAAISTPHGRGGIAVIRLSGRDAIEVADKFFRPYSARGMRRTIADAPSNAAVYGSILSEGEVIDDGIATVYRAPRSFTGEDTVEISCHGGVLLTQTVLESALLSGARMAGPGEFSKRAFVNGKMGLSQAEAIINMIDAESIQKLKLSGAAARGALTREVEAIREELRQVLASTYAYIDFPDEDLTDLTVPELKEHIGRTEKRLRRLCESYHTGKAVCEGIPVAIVGKPNTGKSSIWNLLLHEDRAIVTDVAGTTRDVLRETVSVGGVLLRLSDTAGIRPTDDTVEAIGVERSLQALDEAELCIAVFDVSRPTDEEDRRVIEELRRRGTPAIAVYNKIDEGRDFAFPEPDPLFFDSVLLSAKTGRGAEDLCDAIGRAATGGEMTDLSAACVTNARQYSAARAALDAVLRAKESLAGGFTQDIAGMDLEQAIAALGEVDAREALTDVTDAIFHRFCVGK